MMENLQDLITVDLDIANARDLPRERKKAVTSHPKLGLTIGFSSGTSGFGGMHIVSGSEQAAWAGFMLARGLVPLFWANIASA